MMNGRRPSVIHHSAFIIHRFFLIPHPSALIPLVHPSALIPSEVERERVLGRVAADGQELEVVNEFSVELRDERENVAAPVVEGGAGRGGSARGGEGEVGGA